MERITGYIIREINSYFFTRFDPEFPFQSESFFHHKDQMPAALSVLPIGETLSA